MDIILQENLATLSPILFRERLLIKKENRGSKIS